MTWTAPTPPEPDGPMTGAERPMLAAYLGYQRTSLLNICAGLTGEQLVLAASPPSTLTLLGLIRHLTKVERTWFRLRFGEQELEPLYDPALGVDADFEDLRASDAEGAYERYLAECVEADAAVADLDLDATITSHHGTMSLRFVYLHMIHEYARHNGHADLVRQAIDGVTGR